MDIPLLLLVMHGYFRGYIERWSIAMYQEVVGGVNLPIEVPSHASFKSHLRADNYEKTINNTQEF